MAQPINNGIQYVKDTPIRGKDVYYFIQSTDPKVAPIGSPAILPAHQTEGSVSIEGDSLDEQTKMGRVVAASTNEDSIDLSSYLVPGDLASKIIMDAKHNGRQVKVWRVIVDPRLAVEEGDHKAYPAMFGYGVVDSMDITDGDSFSELEYTLNIVGKLADKNADGSDATFPLTDEMIAALNQLYYYERPGETEGEFSDAAGSEEKPATSLKATPTSADIKVGGKQQITLDVEPADASDKQAVLSAATYSSNNESVATVSATGEVTGVTAGQATITVKSDKLEAKVSVKVTAE